MPNELIIGGQKILIVEYEKPLAHALELKLRHEGFDVSVTLNGTDGLQLALAEEFILILLDRVMPQMDGFSVLRELRANGKQTPVIVLSDLCQDEDRQKAAQLGAIAYFVKDNAPISEIVAHIKTSLLPPTVS
jgi:DNA-binding response OmpR family regulator